MARYAGCFLQPSASIFSNFIFVSGAFTSINKICHKKRPAQRPAEYREDTQFCVVLLTPITNKCYDAAMKTTSQNRTSSGQFLPGQSGNPGGRPKDVHRVAELARSYTVEAIETLVDLMRHGKDERVRGTAAQALLDRGWGKAKVEVVSNAESSYLEILKAVNAPLS
jgi:hypothetical protein